MALGFSSGNEHPLLYKMTRKASVLSYHYCTNSQPVVQCYTNTCDQNTPCSTTFNSFLTYLLLQNSKNWMWTACARPKCRDMRWSAPLGVPSYGRWVDFGTCVCHLDTRSQGAVPHSPCHSLCQSQSPFLFCYYLCYRNVSSYLCCPPFSPNP